MSTPASNAVSHRILHVFHLPDQDMGPLAAVNVLHGDDSYLRQLALRRIVPTGDQSEHAVTRVEGDSSTWRDVHDLLRSSSLFSPLPPVVIVDDADSFVTNYRAELEEYVEDPAQGRLILQVKSWPKNTRLYKKVQDSGWTIDCGLPGRRIGSTFQVDRQAVVEWAIQRASHDHGVQIDARVMGELIDLIGESPGVIDQELMKLANFVPTGEPVTAPHIHEVGCGWRVRSTWDLLDSVLEGNAAEAVRQLHRLLQAGEEPIALFGAFSWSLRRFALATQWSDYQSQQTGRRDLAEALRIAGFRNDFRANRPAKAERQLRQLGWHRCQDILRQLLAIDLRLKGTHSKSQDARRLLETYIVELSSSLRA